MELYSLNINEHIVQPPIIEWNFTKDSEIMVNLSFQSIHLGLPGILKVVMIKWRGSHLSVSRLHCIKMYFYMKTNEKMIYGGLTKKLLNKYKKPITEKKMGKKI